MRTLGLALASVLLQATVATAQLTPVPGTPIHVVCDSGCGSPTATPDKGAFTEGATNITSTAGVYNDALAALSSGVSAAFRLTTNRALHVNLRSAAGAELPLPAALAANGGLKIEGVASGVAVPVSFTQPALVAGSAVIGHVIVDTTSTTAVTQATGTNLHAVLDATSTTAVTQATGTNLHAVLDATSTTAVTQATGTNLHAVIDTGSTTAATQATAANLNAQVQGAAASGASKAGNPVQIGGVFNTTQPTVTTGQAVEAQSSARGAQIVATGADTFNVTVNAALPAGTAVIGHVIADSGSTTAVTGNVTVVQPTGTNLHAVLDTTSTTAATQATGTNLHTVTDATSVTVLQPSVNAADALSSSAKATVTASVNVKASAGSVYGFSVLNGAGAGCWMELINSAGAGTIGTGVIFNIALPTSGTLTVTSPVALGNFSAGIAVGVASAVGGAVACGTAATGITIFFK